MLGRSTTVAAAAAAALSGAGAQETQAYGPFAAVAPVGMQAVSERDAREAATPFLDRRLTRDDLARLADAFVEPCDRAALALCRADIARPDAGDDSLTVRLSEGFVEEIRVEGDAATVVRRILRPVLAERPLTKPTLDRAVANL